MHIPGVTENNVALCLTESKFLGGLLLGAYIKAIEELGHP